MVLDDYGAPNRGAQREVHDKVARECGFSILTLATRQGLAIKLS